MSVPEERQGGAPATPAWHAPFLAMLPAVERIARWEFRRLTAAERDEAVQAMRAHAAAAFAQLVKRGKADVANPTTLAKYGARHVRAGRGVGAAVNCRDVASRVCQRRRGLVVGQLDDWQAALTADRATDPAELGALRVDFGDWLERLSPRNRRMAKLLAAGERTRAVAKMLKVTAGRISQLRRELHASWLAFTGEAPAAAA